MYVLTDENGNETVLGDTSVTVVLKPEVDGYTLDVIVTFPDVPKECEPLIFDLNPTCGESSSHLLAVAPWGVVARFE